MAGQNADMTLKVGLDLNFFRQELQKASSSLAGQPIDINVRFNKKGIADQYRLLTRYLGGKKSFDVKIESNTLNELTNKVANFQKTLKNLKDEKVELSINASANIEKFSKEKIRKIRAQIRSDIVSGGAGEIQLPTKLAAPNTSAFIKDVAKKVKEQTSASYAEGGVPITTKLKVPGITDLLKALQKNLNRNPISIATSFKESGRSKAALAKIIRNAEKNKAVLGTELAPLGADEIAEFRRTVESKLSGIKVTVDATLGKGFAAGQTGLAGLEEYMRTQGLSGGPRGAVETGRRAQFESLIESASSKELKRYMKTAEIAGRSALTTKAQMQEALLKINDVAMENILGNMKLHMRDPLPIKKSFLDQVARAVFWMAGVDPAYLKQQAAQRRALPSVNFPGTVPARNIAIGPSTTGRALPASRDAAGLIGAAQSPAGLLPSATKQSGLTAGLEALIQSLVSQSRRGPEGPGAIVSMETGFIPAMRERFAKAAERYLFGVETQVMDLFDAALRQVESAVDLHIAKIQGQISQRMRSAFSVVDLGVQERPMLPGAATGQEPLMLPSAGGTTPQGQMRFNAVRTGEVIPPTPLMLPPAGGTTPRREMRFNTVTSTGGRGGGYVSPGGFPEESMLGMLGGRQGPATFIGAGSQIIKLKTALDVTVQAVEQFRKSQIPLAGTMQGLAAEFGVATQQVLLYGTAYKALAFFMDLPNQALNAAKSLQTFNNQLNAITGSSENADRAFAFVDNLAARFNVPLESARQGFVKLYASMAPAGFSSGEIENLFSGISKASATLGLSSDKVDRVTYAFSQMASKGQLMSEEVSGQLGDVIPGALSIMAEAARMDIATFKKAMEDGVFVGETFKQVMSNVPIVLENRFGKGAANAAKTLQGSMNALAISTQKFYESFEPIVSMGAASIFPIIAAAINNATQAVQAFTTAMQGNTTPAQMLEGNAAQIYGVLQQLREIFTAVAGVIQGIAPTLMIVGKTFLTTAEYVAKLINTPIGGFLADLAVKAGIALIAVQLLTKTGIVGLISQLILLQRSTAAAGGGLLAFAGNLTKTATAAKLFRLAITGLIGAGILFGIEALVNAIGRMANRLSDARKNAIAARDAIKSMTGAELGEQIIVQQNKLQALSRTQKAGGRIGSEKDRQALEQMGMKVSATGGTFVGGQLIGGQYAVDKNLIESFRIREKEQLKAIQDQRKSLYDTTPLPLNEVELGAGTGDEKAAKRALNDAEQLAKQEQQRRIELANFANDMQKIEFDRDVQLSDAAFEHKKNLIDALNAYELSGLNDMQARQVKFAQDLKTIQLDAVDVVRKAMQQTQAAQLNVTAARATANAASVPMAGETIDKSVLRNWLISQGFGRTTGDFTNRGHATPNHMLNAMDMGILGGSDAEALRKTSEMEKKLRATGAFGSQLFGPISDPYGHGAGKGGQNIHLHIPTPGGKVKMTSGLASLMGKQSSPAFSMQTKEQKEGFDLAKEQAKAASTEELAQLEIQNKLKEAYAKTAAVIKSNIDSIFPVEKQKLDVRLQQMRNNLLMQGMPQEYIDYEEKRTAAMEEGAMALDVMKTNLGAAEAELKVYQDAVAKGTALTAEQNANVTRLTGAITAYKDGIASATTKQQEYNIALLEGSIAAMKNADAMKAMQETADRINQAVEGTTGTFKGMFTEIAKGGDYSEIEKVQQELDKAREEGDKKAVKRLKDQLKKMSPLTPVLKKAQEELADQALTMFFDFAMQPVEKFFKDQLGAIFGVPSEEEQRKETIQKMEEQLAKLRAIEAATQQTARNTGTPAPGAPAPSAPNGVSSVAPAGMSGGFSPAVGTFTLQEGEGSYLNAFNGSNSLLSSLGLDSEELSSQVQSFSESTSAFSDQLSKVDSSVWESAATLNNAGEEMEPANKKWMESLGKTVSGLGMAAGAVMGIVAGINQIKEGGTSNVLGGIGMIASMAGSLLGGFSGLFKGSSGGAIPTVAVAANGAVWKGGFRAFANGGMVTGPTLGLIGEGRYNEAIVPLPDGKSIPVQLGGRSARDLMGNNAPGMPAAPALNMKFETTKINGVEYVSREQLEQAMASTRRLASREGAAQGSQLALNKLKNSPTTRRQLGF